MGDLDPPPARQVPVEMELLLQLQGLVPCVCSPGSLPLRSGKFLYKTRKGDEGQLFKKKKSAGFTYVISFANCVFFDFEFFIFQFVTKLVAKKLSC